MSQQPQPTAPMPWDAPDKPSRPKSNRTPWWPFAILAALIGAVALIVSIPTHHDPTSDETKADAGRACQEKFIPARLKAPATAKFSNVKILGADGGYVVSGSVDSQNAFGALVRATWSCTVHSSGDQWVLDSAGVN